MSGSWSAWHTPIAGGEKLSILRDGHAASFPEVIAGWQDDTGCRATFVEALARTPFAGFFWEMPPVARGHADIEYECVAIESRALAGLASDPVAFAANFGRTNETVATFPNLGGDALLVAPRPMGAAANYAHLAAFLRRGPQAQKHEFLQALGRAVAGELRDRSGRIWISTSGLGIAWLHARLDNRPKYYQHQPYRDREHGVVPI
ncbi:MAG: DUF6940 family protein [Rhizomicrobium sp.]